MNCDDSQMTTKFKNHRSRLLQSLDAAHQAYYEAATFGGPSLHFHLMALNSAKEKNLSDFCWHSYAMLASWGMHRMGRGGSKMCEFNEFESSMKEVWPLILNLQGVSPGRMIAEEWSALRLIFRGIRCMASATSLVGNSKIMAHALPNLIPPIDRQYTLSFLYGRSEIKNDIDGEWEILKEISQGFFYPILSSAEFDTHATSWVSNPDFKWDTSKLKVADNLVIGLAKFSDSTQPQK
jgi:hypothetical protein